MLKSKNPLPELPLEERIRAICAEAEQIVDAKAVAEARQHGLPLSVTRRDIENRAPGCACRQALAVLAEDKTR